MTRNRLIAEIINRIFVNNVLNEIEVIDKYRRRLFVLGKNVLVKGPGEPYEALAVDVDAGGRLIVKKSGGELAHLSAGEISIQHKSPPNP